MPDALPLVGPGVDHVLANVDADPLLEVIGNVATGDVEAHNGDGSAVTTYDASPAGGEHVDKVRVLNLFENPIVADLDSTLAGPEVVKGGLTLNQLVNLGVAVGPEPSLQPRDAGVERADRRRRSRRSRRRSRTTSCCPARRWPTCRPRPARR